MKRIVLLFFVLFLLPVALRAQSVGLVQYGDQVFSTGLPRNYVPDGNSYWIDKTTGEEFYKMMSPERLKAALASIERTFGPVKEYKESYNECAAEPMLSVTLTNGDQLDFEDGCLNDFHIVTYRFTIDSDMFPGGLRVGRKPPVRANEGVVLRQDEKNPNIYDFWWEDMEVYGHYILDEKGLIKQILLWTNDC